MNVLERFLKYVSYDTQSDKHSGTHPSTAKQKVLGAALAEELAQLGLQRAHMDEHGYVYAWLPATPGKEDVPCLGLISHMDTTPDAPGKDVSPRIVQYEGGDITLDNGLVISVKDTPALKRCVGQELVVTDGTTLLGSDDKAGVAEIVTAMEYLVTHPDIPHGPIAVAFTPDEEIGQGADLFDIPGFGAAAAFTVDGGELGELEYENFNAAAAEVVIHGLNIHPGEAKNRMKNAALLAMEFNSLLPPAETPAHTEGYEGFYHLGHMEGSETAAKLEYIVRDHDMEKFLARKATMERIAAFLNAKYGAGTVDLSLTDQYYNMKAQIEPHMYLVERAKAAFRKAGVEPKEVAIRGGTDGAQLSYQGLPCPNLSTGGFNFHGPLEFIPVKSLEKMVEILVELVKSELF